MVVPVKDSKGIYGELLTWHGWHQHQTQTSAYTLTAPPPILSFACVPCKNKHVLKPNPTLSTYCNGLPTPFDNYQYSFEVRLRYPTPLLYKQPRIIISVTTQAHALPIPSLSSALHLFRQVIAQHLGVGRTERDWGCVIHKF